MKQIRFGGGFGDNFWIGISLGNQIYVHEKLFFHDITLLHPQGFFNIFYKGVACGSLHVQQRLLRHLSECIGKQSYNSYLYLYLKRDNVWITIIALAIATIYHYTGE